MSLPTLRSAPLISGGSYSTNTECRGAIAPDCEQIATRDPWPQSATRLSSREPLAIEKDATGWPPAAKQAVQTIHSLLSDGGRSSSPLHGRARYQREPSHHPRCRRRPCGCRATVRRDRGVAALRSVWAQSCAWIVGESSTSSTQAARCVRCQSRNFWPGGTAQSGSTSCSATGGRPNEAVTPGSPAIADARASLWWIR